MVLNIGIFPLSAGAEGAVEIAPSQRADATARVWGKLLRCVADDACIHLIFEEAAAEAVLAGKDRPRLHVQALLAVTEFPRRKPRRVAKFFLGEVVGQSRLNLMLPETEAWVEGKVRIEIAGGRIKAVVERVIGLCRRPSKVDRLKENIGEAGRLRGRVEEIGVESRIEHGNHKRQPVVGSEDLLLRRQAVCNDHAADVDIGAEDGIAIGTFDGLDGLCQPKRSSIEPRGRRGAIFEPSEASDVMAKLLAR